jgi:hypothetical protein
MCRVVPRAPEDTAGASDLRFIVRGANPPRVRRAYLPLFVNFSPSLCIAQGTIRRGGGCFKLTCYACRVVHTARAGMADASALNEGRGASILLQWGDNWPLFFQLRALCAHRPGNKGTRRQLLQAKLRSQGPGQAWKMLKFSTGGTGRRCCSCSGVINLTL